jgi:Fe-S-cluster containining protein
LDVLREQHLATADISDRTRGLSYDALMADLEQEGKCLVIAGGDGCKFLRGNNLCAIYPTRPNVCVAMRPGEEQCQDARRKEGLPPLADGA